MPQSSRSGMIISNGQGTNATGDADAIQNDIDPPSDDEYEPPAKRGKGKGKARKKVGKRNKVEEIVKPAFHEEWTDIPDWKGKKESPLMKLPVEVLDKIVCVRPELAPGDYLALAGTCRFFRNHMTDDFFEDVASRHQEYKVPFAEDSTIPHTRPIAGARPFSRTITDWKASHPKIVLDPQLYPVVSTPRTTSKWGLPATYGLPTDYRSGHDVPPGPRSTWSKAQYSVYKEEQASWRKNRDAIRLEARWRRLQQDRNDLAEEKVPYGNKTKQVRLDNGAGGSREHLVRTYATAGVGYKAPVPRRRVVWGPIIDLTADDSVIIDLTGTEEAAIQSAEYEDGNEDITSSAGTWQAPDSDDSDTSDAEDEFQWLWDRGAQLVHDHWPSVWRRRVSEMIGVTHITLYNAMTRYHLTDRELSTLKSFSLIHKDFKEPVNIVFNKRAVEARAMKFQGGPEAHERYVTAMIERKESVKRKKEEKHQRELRRLQ